MLQAAFPLVLTALLAVPPAGAAPIPSCFCSQANAAPGRPPAVVARVEPTIPASGRPPGATLVVLVNATIAPDGTVTDAHAEPADRGFGPSGLADRVFAPAAIEAVRAWRFRSAGDAPAQTIVGINFARSDGSGPAVEPVAVGGKVKVPRAVSSAAAVYPPDALPAGPRPGVLVELTIDAAGTPIDAVAMDPLDLLTGRAVDAALHWQFEPDRKAPRRLVKVSVPFEPALAFGPPRSQWPAPPRPMSAGGVTPPRKIVNVNPVYPPEAQSKRVQGLVAMDALIGEDGSVQAAVVIRAVPLLSQAALDAVRQWKYMPMLVDGKPVPTRMVVTVNFALQGR